MKIVNAFWTPKGNLIGYACDCGSEFSEPATKWTIKCPFCKRTAHVEQLRKQYTNENLKAKGIMIH